MEQSLIDANSQRRVHPGTKAAEMAAGPPLVPLHELDSAFQLQEHLAALHYHHIAEGTKAIDRDSALLLAQPPPGIDRTLWLYELCRFLISQCNSLIVGFLFDAPPCSASTCPEMRASEWQFLCAVHEQPKSCCAIDYCCHTLDWAANVVTDQKLFPSRFVVLADPQSKNVGVKNLINVFRRLHRIFAHAWFQHRSVFWSVEGQTGLYVFFKTVCDLYDLLPAENYKLPPEAEGLEAPPAEPEPEKPVPQILKPPAQQWTNGSEEDPSHPGVGRTNTRRHIRSSPSTGSAVTTVVEADEEDTDGVTRKVKELQISAPETVAEESEVADVPVIVDYSMVDQPAENTEMQNEPALDKDDAASIAETVVEADPASAPLDEVKPEPVGDEAPSKEDKSLDEVQKDTAGDDAPESADATLLATADELVVNAEETKDSAKTSDEKESETNDTDVKKEETTTSGAKEDEK